MDSEWVQQRLMILRAVDAIRASRKRGEEVPDAELNSVDEVAARVWAQIKRELEA